MNIGIVISTMGRREMFNHTYSQWLKFLPENASLFVVEDFNDNPTCTADYYFTERAGIAKVKNKSIHIVEDFDIIVLADDDVYPICKDWHLPYINSGMKHMSYNFDKTAKGNINGNKIIKRMPEYNVFANPCGCLLFYTKECIQKIGGMNEAYGLWSFEHVEHSLRIFNSGLTPCAYMDVPNSKSLFYSHDYHETCERSVSKEVRKEMINVNQSIFNANKKSKEFIPYKEMIGRIITTYFTGFEDPQRGEKRKPDIDEFVPLVSSIKDLSLTIISDCLSLEYNGKKLYYYLYDSSILKYSNIVADTCEINPYLQRWVSILDYLKEVKEDYVFCVDATDVEMLRNPFKDNLGNYLWVGDEPSTINNEWLKKHHSQPLFDNFFKTHANKPLLNAGVLGGRTSVVKSFLERMVWYIQNHEILFSDMALFNFVLYTEFPEMIKHGREVTNVFKSYSVNPKHNTIWKHK